MAQPDSNVTVSWAHSIETRDGTLSTDAKMVNAFVEKTEEGMAVVKRSGTFYPTFAQPIPAGTAQGLVYGTQVGQWSIVSDTLYSLFGMGTFAIPSVPVAGLDYDYTPNYPNANTLFIKNRDGLWSFNGGSITKVTSANYPATTVPGLVELDGVLYVMDVAGKIYGSAINDGTTWPALDFVAADPVLGMGAALVRHLNYICAFYEKGLMIYWDANAAPNGSGIALQPVQSAIWRTGSVRGSTTVREMSDVTYWVAQTEQYHRTVQSLQGLEMVKISTPFVEKVLNLSSMAGSFANTLQPDGHSFYIITLPDLNVSLAYDADTKLWHLWSSVVSGVEQYFVGKFNLSNGLSEWVQDITTGKVMQFSPTTYTDATGSLNVTCVTPNYDWGTLNYKRFAAMFQIADTVNTTIGVSFSDNDYASFSTPRTIDLSTAHKQLRNCGSSRRRAWKMTHSDNTPLRLDDVKIPIDVMQR